MKKTEVRRYLMGGLVMALISTCLACPKPITSAMLLPNNIPDEHKVSSGPLLRSIFVESVGGGNKKHMISFPGIENPVLKEAIVQSLERGHYLSAEKDASEYRLTVFIVEIDCPLTGSLKTVTTFVRYKLIGNQTGDVFFDEIIDASDTKRWDDVPDGKFTLARAEMVYGLALENAMKKNIKRFIKELSLLNQRI